MRSWAGQSARPSDCRSAPGPPAHPRAASRSTYKHARTATRSTLKLEPMSSPAPVRPSSQHCGTPAARHTRLHRPVPATPVRRPRPTRIRPGELADCSAPFMPSSARSIGSIRSRGSRQAAADPCPGLNAATVGPRGRPEPPACQWPRAQTTQTVCAVSGSVELDCASDNEVGSRDWPAQPGPGPDRQ
jgi:hypothetical protein